MNQRQHYVPKVYLKQFSKGQSGHLYAAGPKPNFEKIREKHVKHVCFHENFYTLKDETKKSINVDDHNYIEKNAFRYESRLLQRIIDKLRHKNVYLNKSYFESLIDIYLNIKQRNPCYRNSFNASQISKSVNRQIDSMRLEKDWIEKMSGENFDIFIERIKEKITQDKDLPNELHKRILVDSLHGEDGTIDKIKKELQQMNLFVFEPWDDCEYFLTSDNPGYTTSKDKVFNTHFSQFSTIGFPLNSKQFMLLLGRSSQSPLEIHKRIQYVKLKTEAVQMLNYGTIINSNEYVFCEHKQYLVDIIKKYQSR